MKKISMKIKNATKEILKNKNGKRIELVGKTLILTSVILSAAIPVFAADGDTTSIDTLIKWMANWTMKIGFVVAFFGGIQTSLGFKNDDADGKVRGLKTLASGFMVAAISKSLDLFGIS